MVSLVSKTKANKNKNRRTDTQRGSKQNIAMFTSAGIQTLDLEADK